MIMENPQCMLPTFVFLLLVILIKSWRSSKSKNTTRNLPPGPWKLPVLGNIHQLVGSTPPHHRLTDLANKYGPIMYLQLGHLSTVVISSSKLAEEIMKTRDLVFATRPFILAASVAGYNGRGIIFGPFGDHWRQLKKICKQELLSPKRVKFFGSVREEEISDLIRSLASSSGAPVNLSRMLIALSYRITSRMVLGNVSSQQIDKITPIVAEILVLLGGFNIADMFPSIKLLQVITGMRSKLQKLHQEVDAILEEIIREQREKCKFDNIGSDNLIKVLLNLQHNGMLDFPLTTQDIKAVILDMFLAGYEPHATAVQWMMAELVKQPKILEGVQKEVRRAFNREEKIDETSLDDLPYMNSIIKETLRLHPPGPLLLPRESRERVEVCGYEIPEKTRTIINVQAIFRDPQHWSEPNRFYPERFENSPIDFKGTDFELTPFDAGRRICPGMHYATLFMQLVLANLLCHFDWKIPNGIKPEDMDMSDIFGAAVMRKNDLLLVPVPYVSLQSSN